MTTKNNVLCLPGGRRLRIGGALSKKEWSGVTQDRLSGIPVTLPSVIALARRLFPPPGQETLATSGALKNLDECSEPQFAHFLTGLQNPEFGAQQLAKVQTVLDESGLELRAVTSRSAHFELHWFNGDPAGYGPDLSALLETLWGEYTGGFGREPYRRNRRGRIAVHILDLGRLRGDTTVSGDVIRLNRRYLDAPGGAASSQRKALAAHELFHRVQYAFGFRRRPAEPAPPYQWFSEGTAGWAEDLFAGTVTSAAKTLGLYRVANAGLFRSSYFSQPFWRDNFSVPNMRTFLENLEALNGDLRGALRDRTSDDAILAWLNTALQYGRGSRVTPQGTRFGTRSVVEMNPSPAGGISTLNGFLGEMGMVSLLTTVRPAVTSSPLDAIEVRSGSPGVFNLIARQAASFNARVGSGDAPPAAGGFAYHLLRDGRNRIVVDPLGNVIIHGSRGRRTVLGYGWSVTRSDLAPGAERCCSLGWFDSLDSPFAGAENLEPVGPAGVPVRTRARNGVGTATRHVILDGDGTLVVETTLGGVGLGPVFEFELHQRTSPSAEFSLNDHDGGENGECRRSDCDPLTPAGMRDAPSVDGLQLQEAIEPWQAAPGWIVCTYSLTGASRDSVTITQRYCLGGCPGF